MVVEMTMCPLQHSLEGLEPLTQPVAVTTFGDAVGALQGKRE